MKLNEQIMWIPSSQSIDTSSEIVEFPQESMIFSYQDFVHAEFSSFPTFKLFMVKENSAIKEYEFKAEERQRYDQLKDIFTSINHMTRDGKERNICVFVNPISG